MRKFKLLTKKNIFLLIFCLLILDLIIIAFINLTRVTSTIDFSLSTSFTDYYNYQPVNFNYVFVNKARKSTSNNISAKLSECNESLKICKDVWTKKITLKKNEIVKESGGFTNFTTTDFGLKKLVLSAFDEEGNILGQKSLIVNLKNFTDELYLNLQTDKDLVADGDYVKLSYVLVNRSQMAFQKSDFAITLNFAGPLEIAQDTGKLIEDISQDLLPGQTINGQGTWVANPYENKQGGVYNVSLLLSYREKDNKLTPVYDQVKQVQWP